MKYPHIGRSLLAAFLAVVMFLSIVPAPVRAASSSEIKQQINALKDEKAIMQAKINELRGQYNANANEIQDMVNQKNAIDQEIALLHSQVVNINSQITAYSLLIADLQVELETAQAELDVLNEKHKERIQAMEEEGKVTYWEVIFQANSCFLSAQYSVQTIGLPLVINFADFAVCKDFQHFFKSINQLSGGRQLGQRIPENISLGRTVQFS